MYTDWKPPGGFGGAERPSVYGRGGGFTQRPPTQYNIPSGGRGNGLPGMGQPGVGGPLPPYQAGGVTGYAPGMQGIGTGVGNPVQAGNPDPNNIVRGGGSIGGNGYYGMPYGWRGLLGG